MISARQCGGFSSLGDTESEMEELRMLTRVTSLRRQIECKHEGSWMFVSDDTTPNGTARRVTSYGRATRSFVRSVSRDMDFDPFAEPSWPEESTVLVEYPDSSPVMSRAARKSGPDTVEIVEVTDEDDIPPPPPVIREIPIILNDGPSTSPTKKTSVITLGKGNIVFIDPEESNFKVTAVSKAGGENCMKHGFEADRKPKRVEFCKTEVHFTPESGRFNIVETDEKPPPTQIFRKKKRLRDRPRENVESSAHYNRDFGAVKAVEKYDGANSRQNGPTRFDPEKIVSVRREHSPLASRKQTEIIIPVQTTYESDRETGCNGYGMTNKKVGGNIDNYLANRKDITLQLLPIKVPPISIGSKVATDHIQYLGNVSPKLKNLIQNSEKNEFIFRSKKPVQVKPEECKVETVVEPSPFPTTSVHETGVEIKEKVKKPDVLPPEVITEVKGSSRSTKSNSNKPTDGGNLKVKAVAKAISKAPSYSNVVTSKYKSSNKMYSCTKQSSGRKECPRTKDSTASAGTNPQCIREKTGRAGVYSVKTVEIKSTRQKDEPHYETIGNRTSRVKQEKATTEGNSKLQKLIRDSAGKANADGEQAVRMRRSREPLKSFEKVSNGWVGHCIVPVRRDTDSSTTASSTCATPRRGTTKVSVTTLLQDHTKMPADKIDASNTGVKKVAVGIKVITTVAHDVKNKRVTSPPTNNTSGRCPLSVQKRQFSLSKEHLKSVSLVRETLLSRQRSAFGKAAASDSASKASGSSRPARNRGKASGGGAAPRNRKKEAAVARVRRDSEQSDDSVLRADEEVRAYMFNNKVYVG